MSNMVPGYSSLSQQFWLYGNYRKGSNQQSEITQRDPCYKAINCQEYMVLYEELIHRVQYLQKKLERIESSADSNIPRKNKRIRRQAKQVPRIYKCTFFNCEKEYGSQASFKNHKKLKHGIRLIRKYKKNGLKNTADQNEKNTI